MGKKKLLCCILALALACTALAGCASREAGLKALVSKLSLIHIYVRHLLRIILYDMLSLKLNCANIRGEKL